MNLIHGEKMRVLANLEAMPDFLVEVFSGLPQSELTVPGPDQAFSPVEHVWHLADLERQGFAIRIQRLRAGESPHLPDFDGDAVAREGNYKARSLEEGIAIFRAARSENIAAFRNLASAEWLNAGTQEGVGRVSLCDIPAMMAEHDESHRSEISAWLGFRKDRRIDES